MLPSEKIAIAAHLHVLLRRRTGRVTDTEWMAANAEYAREIIRFARASAQADGHADLAEWADKLEAALGVSAPRTPGPGAPAVGPTGPDTQPPASPSSLSDLTRYLRGIR